VISDELEQRGFALEEMVLEPGTVTRIIVKLHLAEQRVSDFRVRFYLLGNTPVQQAITSADEEAVAAELYATVARTPYSDENWLSNLVTRTVEAQLARMAAYADQRPGTGRARPTTEVADLPPQPLAPLTDTALHLQLFAADADAAAGAERPPYERCGRAAEIHRTEARALQARLPATGQHRHAGGAAPRRTQMLRDCSLRPDRVDSTRWLLDSEARLALGTCGDWLAAASGARAGSQSGLAVFERSATIPERRRLSPMRRARREPGRRGRFRGRILRWLGQLELTPQVYRRRCV
jgi:hypothetical protein